MMTSGIRTAMKFLGIDLHSNQFTVCCLGADTEKPIWRRTFYFNDLDLQRFIQLLDSDTYIAVEASTGSMRFYELLQPYVRETMIVDPRKLRLISMVGQKTDRIDAKKLAVFLKIQILTGERLIEPVYVPEKTIQNLRSLFTTYKLQVKQRSAIKNRLHSLLKQELFQYKKGEIFNIATRQEILTRADMPDLCLIQLQLLYAQVDNIQEMLSKIEHEIKILGSQYFNEVRILTSMKGISVRTALAILADVGTIYRFSSSKKLASYLRSTPSVDSSNEVTRIGKTSKSGRKLSINMLTQSINHFKNGNQRIAHWAHSKVGRMARSKIRMAICRRVITEIYQMLQKNELHYQTDPENHLRKMDTYRRFLKKHNPTFSEA